MMNATLTDKDITLLLIVFFRLLIQVKENKFNSVTAAVFLFSEKVY